MEQIIPSGIASRFPVFRPANLKLLRKAGGLSLAATSVAWLCHNENLGRPVKGLAFMMTKTALGDARTRVRVQHAFGFQLSIFQLLLNTIRSIEQAEIGGSGRCT